MKNFLLSFAGGFLALIVFFVIFPIVVLGMITSAASDKEARPTGDIVLTIDLRHPYPDQPPQDGLAALFTQTGFVDVLTRLDAAATDKDVKAVFIRSSDMSIGSARAEELRDAIIKLKTSGKPVVVHSQGFMFGSPSPYRAVSAADEIWMQAGTDFAVSGVSMETMFAKGLLDKLGVTAEIIALHEYKTAPHLYTQTGLTEAAEKSMRELGQSIWDESILDITEDRSDKLTGELPMPEVLATGPFGADQAKSLGLIDQLGWPEDAVRDLKKRFDEAELIDIAAYTPPSQTGKTSVIAFVTGEGPIMTGSSGNDLSFNNDALMASDTISAQIYEAANDKDVKAILFRVDSPGGSPVASDQIWRAIQYARTEKSKPVVVSMGSVAASGGYYVSMGADKIVAPRTSITGSIGIYGGRFALSEGLSKVGVNVDGVTIGDDYVGAFSSIRPMTNSQRSHWYDRLEAGYERFVSLAAEGRGMSFDDLQVRARGRVWSGADALDQGLLDVNGGLIKAIEVTKELAQIPADGKISLRRTYQAQSPLEALGGMFGASASELQTLHTISRVTSNPQISRMLSQIEALDREGVQMTAPIIIEK